MLRDEFQNMKGKRIDFDKNCRELAVKLRRHEHGRSTMQLIIALAEVPNSVVAEELKVAGFEIERAKLLWAEVTSEYESYTFMSGFLVSGTGDALRISEYSKGVGARSKCEAINFGNSEVRLEHLLLAVLHKHRSHAYRLLTKLNVNQQRLQNRLKARMKESNGLALSPCD
ncbi:MAG: Clp protease N-terminal domain-containing protein [Candidatus Obscuribacterales bacterium]|nr:Clp protease N-terminal domain-containing protein [Candidatus Obscuribacterales bacterium]